jgi:hypothetical protein
MRLDAGHGWRGHIPSSVKSEPIKDGSVDYPERLGRIDGLPAAQKGHHERRVRVEAEKGRANPG